MRVILSYHRTQINKNINVYLHSNMKNNEHSRGYFSSHFQTFRYHPRCLFENFFHEMLGIIINKAILNDFLPKPGSFVLNFQKANLRMCLVSA